MSIEDKLAAYRLRKKREKQMETTKSILRDIATFGLGRSERRSNPAPETPEGEHLMQSDESISPPSEHSTDDIANERFLHLYRVKNGLYLLLWVMVFVIAIEYEFGIVYFIMSLFLLIWFNTRTGPKAPGEVSAYSVFNPNCEAIDGTLNAEQFESELRFGALSVH